MSNTMLKPFDHKICRSCGQSFTGEKDVCNTCFEGFRILEKRLSQDNHVKSFRHCKYCDRPFIPNGTQSYCTGINSDGLHYRQCVSCGLAFKVNVKLSSQKTCSPECRRISFVKSGKGKFKPKGQKICSLCGKPFTPNSSRQEYCAGPHYRSCVICGNDFEISSPSDTVQTCSESCRVALIAKTTEDRYGEDNIFKTQQFKDHMVERNLVLYGVDHYSKTDKYKQRYRKTMMERYGVATPQENEEIRNRTRQTNQSRYNGPSPLCSSETLDKLKSNNRIRYGYDWYNQQPEVKKQLSEIQIQLQADTIQDLNMREAYLQYKKDPKGFLSSFGKKLSTFDLARMLGYADTTTILDDIHKYDLHKFIRFHMSKMESDIIDYIKSLDDAITVVSRSRDIISPYEIDIYLPQYKIGIECNPTITHNSTITLNMYIDPADTSGALSIDYHRMKTDMCESNEIFLLHIFGYDWSLKSKIIKSMISNLLHKSSFKYYARNLHVEEISNSDCKIFLNNNHRQGATTAKIRLGLFTADGLLVSVMTFNKMRISMGASSSDTENTWELSRFCSLLNTHVIGGASKLFTYFLRRYQYDKIVSFSDRAHTQGKLYKKLGFRQVNVSEPNYVWVDYKTDMYYNRVTCQKKNLPKLFNEPDLDIENQTEKMIMTAHGFVQVFDSGTIRWEYTM